MARADTPDCNANTAADSGAQLISPPTLGAPAAVVGMNMVGHNEDGLGADGLTQYTCSLQIVVAQGQKKVVLVEGWTYAEADYPGDCTGCEGMDYTVTLKGLPQTYTSYQHGDMNQPPSGPWIEWPASPYYEGSWW
jgi:hypothetical protein